MISNTATYCNEDCEKHDNTKVAEAAFVYSKRSNVQAVIAWRQRAKARAVLLKGGKCCLCGYEKSIRALHFHHMDPCKKDFAVGAEGVTRAWNKIEEELKKCILVCSNCHCEIHDGVYPDLSARVGFEPTTAFATD